MRVAFRLVDVFTEHPLTGNQLCVMLDPPDAVATPLMQSLAAEIGFSETTFVTGAQGDRYHMRIFTPAKELPFAGHPTLGTAFVLVSEGRVSSPAVQEVTAGEFPVEVDVDAGFAWMEQLAPEFGPEVPDRERVARAAGLERYDLHPDLPAKVVFTGLRQLIVPVRGEEEVARASIEPRTLTAVVEEAKADGLYLFALAEGGAVARFFGPGVGVDEDPATGSAAGPLGAYLAEHGVGDAKAPIRIRQGEKLGRPSELHVEVTRDDEGWHVRLGGGVRVVGRGEFDLPEG
jgi:trans-2,3-dihydro-3-hydroxyanthranilate isomerase